MSFNTLDERLYHYEYRRPRFNNPTYNSSHVFNSINMFVRLDMPTPQMRSYGKSIPKNDNAFNNNQSEVINSRYAKPSNNYSTILPPIETQKQSLMMHDKDYYYMKNLEQKNQQMQISKMMDNNYRAESRNNKTLDYSISRNRGNENPENLRQKQYRQDSLTQSIHDFQSMKR